MLILSAPEGIPQPMPKKACPMITGVHVPEYKILKGIDIPIRDRLTVVVGPNGSGKSTLLAAVEEATSEGPSSLLNFVGEVSFLNLEDPEIPTGVTRVGWSSSSDIGSQFTRIDGRKSTSSIPHTRIARFLRSRLLRLDSRVSSQVSYSENKVPVLSADGESLASVVGWLLKTGRAEIIEAVLSSLRALVPQVERIWVENARMERDETEIVSVGPAQYPITRKKAYWGELLMFDTVSKKGIPASEMSEGTILATALLTLLHCENPPNLLLMDDIDKGLHPRAIASLVEIIQGIQEQRPDLQIIATTHSPYLLDHIPIQSVICMHVADDGFARAKPLSHHPEYDHWKDVMTAGEFWSSMGEEWVTQGEKVITL